MEQIKLVIWDLDDTFWRGTISEGPVEQIPDNHEIVKTLASRGIISSICSKNDESVVLEKLEEVGIRDYFVSPSVNWAPKGLRIKELIESLNLRPTNVLFIDDNEANLQEARFVVPNLNVALPEILGTILNHKSLTGKPDPKLERLSQYKVLEKKVSDQSGFIGDSQEFLRQSKIQVALLPVKANDLDRLDDLINRSNQLNFTKLRVGKSELSKYRNLNKKSAGAVWVRDKYGDYGLAGFYALENDDLVHFTFSCRILGLGVETWLYRQLGRPNLNVSGEVSVDLNSADEVDWIEEVESHKEDRSENFGPDKLLIKGGCDLRQLRSYLRADVAIDEEMNYVSETGFPVHNEHTEILRRANPSTLSRFGPVIDRIKFLDRDAYTTEFLSQEFKFKIYSILMDYTQGLYRYRDTEFVVPYGQFNNDVTKTSVLEQKFGKKFADWFAGNFTFEGGLSETAFARNLEWISSTVPDNGRLILLNGSEIEIANPFEEGRHLHHRKFNLIVDEIVARHSNVSLVDVRKIVSDPTKVTNNIRHYSRDTYQMLAAEIDRVLNESGVGLRGKSGRPQKRRIVQLFFNKFRR